MNDFTYSDKGLALTKRFEGLRLRAFEGKNWVWTIGWGHTGPDVFKGKKITLEEANALLIADTAKAAETVKRRVKVKLTQGQFDALVDFVFNIGSSKFQISMLLKYVNAGDFASAADQFKHWTKLGLEEDPGLVQRRAAERRLFALTPTEMILENEDGIRPGN